MRVYSSYMSKRTKHSVAVVVRNDGDILAIRRPGNDDELPGIWGLPAGSYREGESLGDVVSRIGRDKLGAKLTPIRLIASGAQDRPQYRLEMELWEASMDGTPTYPEWQWAPPGVLKPGAASGSLCCRLALLESNKNERPHDCG